MIRHRAAATALAALLVLVGVASTATNLVAPSRAGVRVRAVTANELKPPECASLDLEEIRVGGGGGGAGHAGLFLGTNGNDRIIGGDDDINAGGGLDICIGGPGTDTFKNCEVQYP